MVKEGVGGGKPQATVVGDRQAGKQSCHEIESERNLEEAWLYRVPQCEICQPHGPHTEMDPKGLAVKHTQACCPD